MGSAALGTGEGKVAEALEALVRIGYQGTIVLENDYRGENRRSVGSDLRFVREHLSSFRRECAH
jgi:sugar phosphate isomerase/epimerase